MVKNTSKVIKIHNSCVKFTTALANADKFTINLSNKEAKKDL